METNHKKIVLSLIDSLGVSNYEALGIIEVIKNDLQARLSSNTISNNIVTNQNYDTLKLTTKKTNNVKSQSSGIKTISTRLGDDEYNELQNLAYEKNCTISELLRQVIHNGQKENIKQTKNKKEKRVLSEEERQSLVERIAKARESKRLKQLQKIHITIPSNGQTNLKDWADKLMMQNKIKQRMYNGLIKLHNRGLFLEDTHQHNFMEIENLGLFSWKEFLKLRFEHFTKK
jgi:hypothetical protein